MRRILYLGLSLCIGISSILNTSNQPENKLAEILHITASQILEVHRNDTKKEVLSANKTTSETISEAISGTILETISEAMSETMSDTTEILVSEATEANEIESDTTEANEIESDITKMDSTQTEVLSKRAGLKKRGVLYEEPQKALLDVKAIFQYPELPTGCEITSLTMVLNYLDYNVTKVRMARKYLNKAEIGTASYWDAFLGNPETEASYGCFAPVIVEAAEEYLEFQNSDFTVYDLTGTSLEELYVEILNGNPVIVWGSMYIDQPIYYSDVWEIEDEIIRWYANEHCMVLIGFDRIHNTVLVCDPLRGIEEYNFDAFNENYIAMESQDIVIK